MTVLSDNGQVTQRSIGTYVKELRTDRGWTIAHLAAITKINPASLSNLELGKSTNPSLSIIIALASAFRISTDELLSFDVTALPPEVFVPKTLDDAIIVIEDLRKRVGALEKMIADA